MRLTVDLSHRSLPPPLSLLFCWFLFLFLFCVCVWLASFLRCSPLCSARRPAPVLFSRCAVREHQVVGVVDTPRFFLLTCVEAPP